jgi:hypothetical protein
MRTSYLTYNNNNSNLWVLQSMMNDDLCFTVSNHTDSRSLWARDQLATRPLSMQVNAVGNIEKHPCL